MKKIFLLHILTVQFLFSSYLSPNTEDWSSRFKAENKNENITEIPNGNVVWVDFNSKTADIYLKNIIEVYGVQFEFDGVNFKEIQNSGFLKENNFEVSHNEKMLLSFSFQGKAIPIGEHKLATVNLDYTTNKENATMKALVMAGKGGTALDFPYYDTNKKKITKRTIIKK